MNLTVAVSRYLGLDGSDRAVPIMRCPSSQIAEHDAAGGQIVCISPSEINMPVCRHSQQQHAIEFAGILESAMYRFKLEPLLNHRRYQEEVLQKELVALKMRLLAEQDQLQALKKRKRRYLQQLLSKQKKGRPASEIKLYVDFVDHLTAELEAQHQKVADAQQSFDQQREALVAAMKKRKVLEKLKEKGRQAYEHTQRKKERELLDEVAGHQYILKS